MKLKVIHTIGDGCANGHCPQIYETDRDTYLIQGYTLTKNEKDNLALPEKEDVIEIPKELLKSFIEITK